MRELAVELKQLRMHGMAGAWADLVEQGGGGGGGAALESSRWLLEHLLQAERFLNFFIGLELPNHVVIAVRQLMPILAVALPNPVVLPMAGFGQQQILLRQLGRSHRTDIIQLEHHVNPALPLDLQVAAGGFQPRVNFVHDVKRI